MSVDVDNEINERASGEWIDIFDNGDLCRKVLSCETEDGRKPKNGDKVEIRVFGRLNDDKIVENFPNINFTLGLSDVVQAWELAVPFMTVGEVNEIKTSARFAYGDRGRAPDIPPNAQITYEIELISITNGDDPNLMNADDRLSYSSARKERGNYYFNREDFSQAIEVYQRGIKSLTPRDDDDIQQQNELMASAAILYNNLAAAQLKISAYNAVLDSVNSCLLIQPRNAKALFRRAKALFHLNQIEKALRDFITVQQIDAKCPGIKEDISLCRQRLKMEREQEKILYKKMVKGLREKNNYRSSSKYQWLLNGSKNVLTGGVALLAVIVVYRFFVHVSSS